MTIRIAILAACAGTLALTQPDIALANYSAASDSGGPASSTAAGAEPVIVLAQSAIVTSRSNITRPSKRAEGNQAMGDVSTTRGRKVQPAKTGKDPIFDRWGNKVAR